MVEMWKTNHNLFAILYGWFLAKVASQLTVLPGTEFRVAYEEAMKYGGKVILGDHPTRGSLRQQSKILIIGGTGYIGKFLVEASAKTSHPTFVLVRESTVTDPVKGKLVEGFKNCGVTLAYGDSYNHGSLVEAIKQVDVVISTLGNEQLNDQGKICDAIKEAGNVKKFYPSEFGVDVDHQHAVEPAKFAFAGKSQLRRSIEALDIPHTYLISNAFAGYFLPTLIQPGAIAPPCDKVVILGDGNAKVFIEEHDIGTFTIKTVDDPRTCPNFGFSFDLSN